MSTPLPRKLVKRVQAAHAGLRSRSDHALLPIYRKTIYESFPVLGQPRARGWLAVATAQHVFPLWRLGQPMDTFPSDAIEVAIRVLHGDTNLESAESRAGEMWARLEELAGAPRGFELGNSFYAAQAAISALFEATGRDWFEGVEIGIQDTDNDLDPWCSDTALWAAAAFAGRIGDPASDGTKRLAFWYWWLNEAIPAAWHSSTSEAR